MRGAAQGGLAESAATATRNVMEKILVIEDDSRVQRALRRLFEPEGYEVETIGDGRAGLEAVRAAPPMAVVLDMRLPGLSGRDVCRAVKQIAPNLPVIMLSAVTDVADKVALLELGADDYVTKPFSPRELLARVQAAVRRSARPAPKQRVIPAFGDVTIDVSGAQVFRGGTAVALTPQEFKMLRFLLANAERVVSREELLNEVWGYQAYPTTRTVDTHMLKLRQKLEKDPANPAHLKTVHGMGYKFVP